MKVVLRNRTTDLYFIGPNMWTNDPAKALDFRRPDGALKLVKETALADLELIVFFRNARQGLRLPVGSTNFLLAA